MYKKHILATTLIIGLCHPLAQAQAQQSQLGTRLPSERTQQAVKNLPVRANAGSSTLGNAKIQKFDIREQKFHQYSVRSDQVPESQKGQLKFNTQGRAEVPFVAPNTIILQFKKDVSEQQIAAFLAERNLAVVRTYPKIGAIQAEGDLSGYFKPKLTDNSANDALLRGLVSVVKDFKADPRIQNATPDLVLRDQTGPSAASVQITNLLTPSGIILSDPAAPSEVMDWGITDIQADQLWSLPGAQDGVLFGVMDVGFARHEDIIFLGFQPDTDVDDHGNHVAAIACGRHDNRVGIKGVLPHCLVRARSGDVFFDSVEGGQVLDFLVLFSQVLATLEKFVDSQDDVGTFNVSLGYNWRSNFGINPDLPDSAQWRTLVASQGAFLVPLLELANRNGRVIFSAAGNDSSGLATPIGAKFASPFNWAAITAREKNIADNGVIVEAHDRDGNRASFSNTGGHISCPGVDIFSAVAFDPQKQIAHNAYGTMSGTSMASPYCAAGQALFKLVRPGYSGVEAVNCLTTSSDNSSSGAPMLRLQQALTACPARS